jgi:hypothetical protein
METSFGPIPLTFFKSERFKEYGFGYSSIQASVIAQDIVNHPTGGGATYDKEDVFAFSCP